MFWFGGTHNSPSFLSRYKATGATPQLKRRDCLIGTDLKVREGREYPPVIWKDLGQAPGQDLCKGSHFENGHTPLLLT